MQFDFNLSANQSQHIDVVGTFLKYKAGTGTIRVRMDGGGYIDLLPGQGVNNVKFTSVDVQDRTGAQNVGTILAGIYDFRDDRITGSVEVIDGGKNRTNAGVAFTAHVWCPPPAADKGAVLQLWNPAGSGKNLIVEQVVASVGGQYSLGMKLTNTQLVDQVGTIGSKKCAGPASVASVQQSGAGLPLQNATFAIGASQLIKFAEPWVIAPGYGLSFGPSTLGISAGVDIEYFEEPV